MRDQFDISGVFETTEFEIAQMACMSSIGTKAALTFLGHGHKIIDNMHKQYYIKEQKIQNWYFKRSE